MNIHHLRRALAVLAALATALVAAVAGPAAAFAATSTRIPNPGWGAGTSTPPPVVHTVIVGGMPGWQIALIAVGAALLAATAAVLAYRALATRRPAATATA
jgi:hypothetical protein